MKKTDVMFYLGAAVIGCSFIVGLLVMFVTIPSENQTLATTVVSQIMVMGAGVVGYYFGSSKGQEKNGGGEIK